jgi:hypothetical protein
VLDLGVATGVFASELTVSKANCLREKEQAS